MIVHTAHRSAAGVASRLDIERILHPGSVAVFGASEDVSKFGGRIINFLVKHGFAGAVYPINPNRAEIVGRRAYPRISAVPQAPDVAILALPGDRIVDTLAEAAQAGVGCCVVITTGFAEGGVVGIERQAEIVDLVARSGMRVVGPNCMGFIVPHHHMALCSSVVLNTETLGDGSIGLISQSGALMVTAFDRAKTDGIGMRYAVSLGNQSDLEICDFLEYMIADRATSAICLYIEGLLDGARFKRAATACREAGKPLIVLKSGRTAAGVVAARSHTASLAGSFEVFEAVCREHAVVLAKDPDDMIRTAHFLTAHPGPRTSARVAVLSSSGGGGSIGSDRVSELGLELATLSDDTKAALGVMLLDPQAVNPVDLGGRRVAQDVEIAFDCTRILLADPAVDFGLALLMSMPFYTKRTVAIAEAVKASGKPVLIACTPGAAADAARQELRKMGLVTFDSFEQALRVAAMMADYDRLSGERCVKPQRPANLPAAAAEEGLCGAAMTETEVKRLLARYGIAVPREAFAPIAAQTGAAADSIGYPAVLKLVSCDIVHKSDVGAVRVGLRDNAEVIAAATAMLERVRAQVPNARIDGFSVQAMARGEAEVIIGSRRDPQFGPIVIVGLGGIAVEMLDDVAVMSAPVSAADAVSMIARLKAAPLFAGARGRPLVDVDAIVDAVVRLSWLAHDLGERLVDLEVNPLIVGRRGEGAIAVDARATLKADR
jgi:acetyl-CoA synthetase (ADP-forming)